MAHQIVDANSVEASHGVFKPLRRVLGVSAFGINQLEFPPGREGPEHDHKADGQEEVYAIVKGVGTIRVDGEEHELRPGQFVFLSPDARRPNGNDRRSGACGSARLACRRQTIVNFWPPHARGDERRLRDRR